MKTLIIRMFVFFIGLCVWPTLGLAQTLGGGSGQLRIEVWDDYNRGTYCVYRAGKRQFYSKATPMFLMRIGDQEFRSSGSMDVPERTDISGTKQYVTKRFSKSYKGNSFTIEWTITYDKSNPEYLSQTAVIDATNIPIGTKIIFGYSVDAYVNGCDGGLAYILPDLKGLNGSKSVPKITDQDYLSKDGKRKYDTNLTRDEVNKLRLVAGKNGLTSSSAIIGYFPIGRPFDMAASHVLNESIISKDVNNGFLFGDYSVIDCHNGGLDDDMVEVAYILQGGEKVELRTGLTFSSTLDGELDYLWNGKEQLDVNTGDSVELNIDYLAYTNITGGRFKMDLQGLTIDNCIPAVGFNSLTTDCTSGKQTYEVTNVILNSGQIGKMRIPVNTMRYGEFMIDANAISNTKKVIPIGAPATLKIYSTVDFASAAPVEVQPGNSAALTIKLPDGIVANDNLVISLKYDKYTASHFSSLPTTITLPKGKNSVILYIKPVAYMSEKTSIEVSILGTNHKQVIPGTASKITVNVDSSKKVFPVNPSIDSIYKK